VRRWIDFLSIMALSLFVVVLGEPPLSLFVGGAGAVTAVFGFITYRDPDR